MDATYELHAELLKAIASPRRLEILHLFGTGPHDVAALASGIGATQPNVSQHLAVLRATGIAEAQRVGRSVRYALCDPDVMLACELMRGVLRRRIARTRVLAGLNGRPRAAAIRRRRSATH